MGDNKWGFPSPSYGVPLFLPQIKLRLDMNRKAYKKTVKVVHESKSPNKRNDNKLTILDILRLNKQLEELKVETKSQQIHSLKNLRNHFPEQMTTVNPGSISIASTSIAAIANPIDSIIQIYKPQFEDSLVTETSDAQKEVEVACLELLQAVKAEDYKLWRNKHAKFLRFMLGTLPGGFKSLDASKPWLVYWSVNALALLDQDYSDLLEGISSTIFSCAHPEGGFGGGYGQMAHLAPTYAAINALALCETEDSWSRVDRRAIYRWLMTLKQENGSFLMHYGGESDTRSVYCALSVASILNILTEDLTQNTAEYLKSCQTFEGGFGGEAGYEAHGGYAFCLLASLCILGPAHEMLRKYVNIPKALKWLSARQNQPEGGLSGRTNKLVDGCYSHWVGGCWALLQSVVKQDIWDRRALQDYVIACCQDTTRGGLRDKPGKHPDAYHSNYTLLGLSGAQNRYIYMANEITNETGLGDWAFLWTSETVDIGPDVKNSSSESVTVKAINPVYALPTGTAEKMHDFFKRLDKVNTQSDLRV